MSGHTPGPWAVGGDDADSGEIEVVSEARPYICLVFAGAIAGTTRANARLIAAAPELLEALRILAAYPIEEFEAQGKPEKVLFGANDWRLRVSDVLAARAAIAHATGADA